MKKLLNTKFLPWAVLLLGVLGGILRGYLYATGVDDRGLLVDGHIAVYLMWVVHALFAAVMIAGVYPLLQAAKYSFNFPASPVSGIGSAVAAMGVLVTAVMALFSGTDGVSVAGGVVGLLCAIALGMRSFCHWQGKRPNAIFDSITCLYMMFYLVGQYRIWSAMPQIQGYAYPLLAVVSVLLACYQNTAFVLSAGNRRMHTLFHLSAVYFCLLSLPKCQDPVLFAALGVWMMVDLCNLTPMPREHRHEKA